MKPVGMYGSSLEVEFVISTIGINQQQTYDVYQNVILTLISYILGASIRVAVLNEMN